MTIALPRLNTVSDQTGGLRFVRVARFALPLFLFVTASAFEIGEHLIKGEVLQLDPVGQLEVLIFGVVGPMIVFLTLTYILGLMEDLERARRQTATLNLNLETIVATRTAALQASNGELAQANLRLRELDQMKSEFVSLVSHELRAPLATLNGGLEVVGQDVATLSPKAQRILHLLMNETQRLTQFVQTLLDVAQLEAGKLMLTCGPVAIRPMLARAVEVVLGPDQERVVWRLPDDLPPLLADEIYTEQVLRNLLSNALKYTPPQSPIELSATVHDQTVQICVTDHGPGILAAEQVHVFERFYRTPNSGERKASGWGLGLYFAHALIDAQGGELSLQSPVHADPQQPGARFIVTLPIAGDEPEHGEAIADRR